MRIVFLGSGAFAGPTLRWLAQSEHDIPLVITQPARGAGRGRHLTRTPVAAIAAELGLNVIEVDEVNAPGVVADMRELEARLGVVIAFGQKLGNDLLAALPAGFVNLHASLLPRYRGAAPINWAMIRGEERTGCTVFRVVEKMDAGPILTTRWTCIKPDETAGELHDRLAGIGVDAMRAAVALFDGEAIPQGEPQQHDQATFAPKLKKSDGNIDWHRPASDIVHLIHGVTPWPGARSRYHSVDGRWEEVTILRARVADDPDRLPGVEVDPPSRIPQPSDPRNLVSVRAHARSDALADPGTIDVRRYVAAAVGHVELLEVKPSSGRIMTWSEYVNGRHVTAGDRFESPLT